MTVNWLGFHKPMFVLFDVVAAIWPPAMIIKLKLSILFFQ